MRVLVVGSGGREHALAWKLAQSSHVSQVFCAPGNAGTIRVAANVDIPPSDTAALISFARREKIDLTVVGPEEPLVKGLADAFQEAGLLLFGPVARAACLEGSKVFAKRFCRRWGIPTADFEVFADPEGARAYVKKQYRPLVVKADGLAAGKGAFVCDDPARALEAIADLMERRTLGEAGRQVVIEERLEGEEISVLALTDGRELALLPPARDHKRAYEGEQGPNTGGMGAFAPAPLAPAAMVAVREKILEPTLGGLAAEGIVYRGVLYAGLMLTEAGPQVLEFNCRFGDPETQAVLPLLEEDLALLLRDAARGELGRRELRWYPGYAVCVVLASGGYPGPYRRGLPISGLEKVEGWPDVLLFHAGTARDEAGRLVTAGGRVLGVTGRGVTLEAARETAYRAVRLLSFPDLHYRRDIGGEVPRGG